MLDWLAPMKGRTVSILMGMPTIIDREPLISRAIYFNMPLLDLAVGLNDTAGLKRICC